MSNYITTAFLNLRKQPQIVDGNVLSVMPPDTVVEDIDNSIQSGFKHVKTVLGNNPVEGFASQKYLQSTALQLPAIEQPLNVPAVHYSAGNRIISRDGTDRVYTLNEPGLFKVDLSKIADEQERKANIQNAINYLDVENSARYAPDSQHTFCNIYAYDVAYCLGGFVPHVWWTADAIVKLQQGINVPVAMDRTVTELTANYIANWFEKFGSTFGWQRLFDTTELQNEVNKGQLGIIVAQRINMNNPGHIVAVVPEVPMHSAKRNNGTVLVPLQSQAGRNNRKYSANNAWWEDKTRFKKFGFWLWKLS